MNEAAISSTVDGLKWFYTIVLVLAIGEAFKQFVADKAEQPEDHRIPWDRLWALLSFFFLVVPFYHGMVRYFFEVYGKPLRPSPYGIFMIIDCTVFTVEASIFFLLTRSLSKDQWRRFYRIAVSLLALDVIWTFFVVFAHTPAILNWAWVNLGACVLLALILVLERVSKPEKEEGQASTGEELNPSESLAPGRPAAGAGCSLHDCVWLWGPYLALAVVLGRTVVDYMSNLDFYFPPQQQAHIAARIPFTKRPLVYIASPYSKGDRAINTHFQCEIFDKMMTDGKAWPVAPLWSHFQHTLFPRSYEDWTEYDKEVLKRCDVLVRLSAEFPKLKYKESESSGADSEVSFFRALGRPVFFSLDDLYEWIDKQSKKPGS